MDENANLEEIRKRFSNSTDAWTFLRDANELQVFCEELIKHTNKGHSIKIFVKDINKSPFSEISFVENISDFVENNGSVEILLQHCTHKDIIESNLLRRCAFYKIKKQLGFTIKVSSDSFNMQDKNTEENIPIDFIIGGEAFLIIQQPNDDASLPQSLSCAKAFATVTQLTKLFDSAFSKNEAKIVDPLNLFLNNSEV